MILEMRHIRQAKLCSKGARGWFESHNLSWSDFLMNGVPVETIEAFDDALGNQVAALVRKEHANG